MRQFNLTHAHLLSLVPSAPAWKIDWPAIWTLWPELPALDSCPQDPIHHAEGDVGLHTRMVAEALVALLDWRDLDGTAQGLLFWAAILHDIGKPATTREEEGGRISARNHARVGTQMARQLLYEACSPFAWREALCGLISEHLVPFWLIEKDNAQRQAIISSWRCRADYLCLHAQADTLGRICADQQGVLDNIALARETFKDYGCFTTPFAFANAASRVSYFEKPDRDPHYAEFEDFRCKVTVMSGLPGAGKDTWIQTHRPDLPMVSLDELRAELKGPATGNQGRVIQAARERAREHLRAGQDFVWNATNISRQLREKSLKLLRDYKAEVEIIYLEPTVERLFSQNQNRASAIPAKALTGLIRKLEPPQDWEAHHVVRELAN